MEYTREYWQPRIATNPNRFRKLNETTDYVELINEPEAITKAGTAFTAARLNNMESGITGAVAGVNEIQGVVDFTGVIYKKTALEQTERMYRSLTKKGTDCYVATSGPGYIYKLTGGTFIQDDAVSRSWSQITTDGVDLYGATGSINIYRKVDGGESFIAKSLGNVYGIYFYDGLFYIGSQRSIITTDNTFDGGTEIFKFSGSITRKIFVDDDNIYVCRDDGFYVIDKASKKIIGYLDETIASVFWINGNVFAGSLYKIYKKEETGAAFSLLTSTIELYQDSIEYNGLVMSCVSGGDIYTYDILTGNTFRASSSFTLPAMPDGARKRILNTHATNAITVTAYSGTTIEGQATMTLSAGHEVELELVGTDWRKVILSQSATPEAGKAMVWPSESSPGTPYTMPTFLVKDMYRSQVESGSGGLLTVLYDNVDNPSIMRVIPKFLVQDIHADLGTGTHPAFIVNGVEKSEIFIGAFQASAGAGSRAVSVPGRTPWVNVNFDAARAACTGKGTGWHLMSNWEWAAIMLWCLKNGFQPRGNTDSGRAHDALWETASGGTPGKTGTGPASWRHDGTLGGIADMVGNVWEWQDGMKLVDGQIYMPNDNHFTQAESSWAAQGVYFDSTGTTGTDETASANGAPILSAARATPSDDCGTGLGSAAPDYDYTTIVGEAGWRSVTMSASYNALAEATRQRMLQSGVAAKLIGTGSAPFTAKGYIGLRNYGERIPIRGGDRGNGANAGIAALGLNNRRSSAGGSVGFRPAFIAI